MHSALPIARYITVLESCALRTHHAEDRPAYQMLLADAASLLASIVESPDAAGVAPRVERHERLWAQLWLYDSVYSEARNAWSVATRESGYFPAQP